MAASPHDLRQPLKRAMRMPRMRGRVSTQTHAPPHITDSPGYTADTPASSPWKLSTSGTPVYPWMQAPSPRHCLHRPSQWEQISSCPAPHASPTPPTATRGTRAISPRHGLTNKPPYPTPRHNPKGWNRVCLGHPPRVPLARTCPKHDGTLHGPQRPQMRIGSTPPHTHLGKPPTQEDS